MLTTTNPENPLAGADVATVRSTIRSGGYQGHTAGLAEGKLQANLAILTADYAADFETSSVLGGPPNARRAARCHHHPR